MKSSLHRVENVKSEKLDIIIVENDDDMFERVKTDIRRFSQYIGKIYRFSYHDDVKKFKHLFDCQLIIANNPDNRGLDFFKSFYLDDNIKRNKILGLLYSEFPDNELRFYRESGYLYEKSQHLFLGFIFKRYGNLEKILEVIQNIAMDQQCYPIIDRMKNYEKAFVIHPDKMELFRQIHNLKYEIFTHLQPLTITLTQFNNDKNIENLVSNLNHYQDYFSNLELHYKKLYDNIQEFLRFELNKQTLCNADLGSETTYHVRQLLKLLEPAPDYSDFKNILTTVHKARENITNDIISITNNGTIERFLKRYLLFVQSLNKLVQALDEYHFKKERD